ncbi:hypothetical protein [Mycolicibacterium sarraceniae]|uniref:Uncharacterized protein n=1 Tax=Mycolicibacterium sarraceniae TaxID=1534348 RepID=A0A7I7SZ45_9MYCO|nr:hypothetical protein MSAR_47170 [Mycolicibacterium sarraceniae]
MTCPVGKTVAIRAAATALDPARHVIIYLANPTIGVRGMLTHIVATLGQSLRSLMSGVGASDAQGGGV